MRPVPTGRSKRDATQILLVMLSLSLLIVLVIVLLSKLPTSATLILAGCVLVATVTVVVLWLRRVLADDDDEPKLPRAGSGQAQSDRMGEPTVGAAPRAALAIALDQAGLPRWQA